MRRPAHLILDALAMGALITAIASPPAAVADDPAAAKPAAAPVKPGDEKFEFETFQLVLLVRAPTWRKLPDAEAEKLQAAHIAHLEKMGNTGKAVVCGPFGDQKDEALRGACVYRVGSAAEARALAEDDPVVKAGQLRIEAVTWFVGKGYMTFPKAPPASR